MNTKALMVATAVLAVPGLVPEIAHAQAPMPPQVQEFYRNLSRAIQALEAPVQEQAEQQRKQAEQAEQQRKQPPVPSGMSLETRLELFHNCMDVARSYERYSADIYTKVAQQCKADLDQLYKAAEPWYFQVPPNAEKIWGRPIPLLDNGKINGWAAKSQTECEALGATYWQWKKSYGGTSMICTDK